MTEAAAAASAPGGGPRAGPRAGRDTGIVAITDDHHDDAQPECTGITSTKVRPGPDSPGTVTVARIPDGRRARRRGRRH